MIIDRYKIREQNETLVLSTIIHNTSISRAHISQLTGLNKASTSAIVKDLIDESLVIEIGTGNSTSVGGRRPIQLSLNKNAGFSLSIDLGYDYISSMLTNLNGEIIAEFKEKNFYVRKDNVIEKINETILSYETYYVDCKFRLIGVTLAIHGIVDQEDIIFTPYYDLDQIDLALELQQALDMPVYVENEANLTALAETSFSTNKLNLVSISIHSGIGAGIIMNGELYHGRNGHSGEVGHMILYPHGVTCPCGNKGCLEQYCSEKAILQQYRLLKADDTRTLYDLADDYYAGDKDVIMFIERAAHEISIGIRNIISGFAPGVVYINSPLTRKLPFLLTLINNCIRSKFSKEVPILTSEIGATASLLGAAVLNLQNFFNIPHLHFSEEPLEKLTTVL